MTNDNLDGSSTGPKQEAVAAPLSKDADLKEHNPWLTFNRDNGDDNDNNNNNDKDKGIKRKSVRILYIS